MAKPYTKFFKESSLSRLVKHMTEHDCGTITAYRNEYTHKENQQRNKSLYAKLLTKGYHVVSVQGSYIEYFNTPEAKEVGEHVYFVVDWKDKGQLKKDLAELGTEFDQESILFIPKGGSTSYLVGVKEDAFPGKGVENELPILKLGTGNNQFLTRVKGRPFYFKESILFENHCANNVSRGYTSIYANKHWKELAI